MNYDEAVESICLAKTIEELACRLEMMKEAAGQYSEQEFSTLVEMFTSHAKSFGFEGDIERVSLKSNTIH